jgi:hypothetical protein
VKKHDILWDFFSAAFAVFALNDLFTLFSAAMKRGGAGNPSSVGRLVALGSRMIEQPQNVDIPRPPDPIDTPPPDIKSVPPPDIPVPAPDVQPTIPERGDGPGVI